MPPLDPGEYRQKLIYQEPAPVRDLYGQTIAPGTTWNDVYTMMAKVEPLSGRQLEWARQLQNETTHSVRCRYRVGVKESGRFQFGTRNLNILAILDFEERHIEFTILCQEQRTGGMP